MPFSSLSGPLETLLDSLTDGVCALDDQGRFIYVNEAASRLFKQQRDGLLGKVLSAELPHLRGSPLEAAYLGAVAKGGPVTVEGAHPPFGAWVEVRASPTAGGLVMQVRDVSERQRAEEQQRVLMHEADRERRHAQTLTRVGMSLVLETDPEKLVQRITDEATALTGAAFGAFFHNVLSDGDESYLLYTISGVPRSAFEKFPMPRNTAIFAPTFTGERTVRYDDVLAQPHYGQNPPYHGMPKGHLPVRSYLAVPVKTHAGEVLGGLFFGHPETGRFTEDIGRLVEGLAAQASIALENARLWRRTRRTEERFRTLVQATSIAVWTADNQGRIVEDSVGWRQHTGQTPEEWKGEGWLNAVHPEDRERATRVWKEALEKRTLYESEYRLRRRDGSYGWTLARAAPVLDAEGKVREWFGTNLDIDARSMAEEANRLKDDFLATVSHELRTPLTSILGWVQLMRTQRLPQERAHRGLESIERSARTQAQLIDDLLDVSRIVTGKLRLEVVPVDLAQVVEAALETVRPAAEAKGVRLLSMLSTSGTVLGDPTRLQQVVWNLLSNAVKFTPKGGRVQVTLELLGSSVLIAVADTGQGIRPDFLPHLFERFRQADGSTTRTYGGLGLGLSIVRQLVELHGGTVRAQSEGEGRGTQFCVTLPLAVARRLESTLFKPPSPGGATEKLCPPELAGVKVLLVDDEADTREMLRLLLESCRIDVYPAASCREALELLPRVRPDILVSDVGMPGEDGYALLRKLRQLPPEEGGNLPAVALTAYARSEDRTRAFLAGFSAHIPKPVEPDELLALLAGLRQRRA